MRPLQENDVFHAIAHPARRAILMALKAGQKPVAELARPFDFSFAAMSQHLKTLKEAGLVKEHREGRNRVYQLQPRPLREVVSWAQEFEAFFEQRLDALERHLDRKYPKR
ncbi:MAG: metalloregulator ArsR/SmtB family transcription factor [Myxococcaceae bacterium]